MAKSVTPNDNKRKFVAYGLPRVEQDDSVYTHVTDDYVIEDYPIPSSVSFRDYDGAITFAGCFEIIRNLGSFSGPELRCRSPSDLDERAREFFTLSRENKTFIFLVANIPAQAGYRRVMNELDLFRRIMHGLSIEWQSLGTPVPLNETSAPEFAEYLAQYGSGYSLFAIPAAIRDKIDINPIITHSQGVFGFVLNDRTFVLPCTAPKTHEIAAEAATAAIQAAEKYRNRVSKAHPEWVSEFIFAEETKLNDELTALNQRAATIESHLADYRDLKGALCYQSNPLVTVVSNILTRFFGITLTIDDKCIEDATLCNDKKDILAVFEIKGITRSFVRNHVNQIDSHRERLGLTASIPGIVIINTMMSAGKLRDKDEALHPDIIAKAVADNVLLIRTLDLLRYAVEVERGTLTKDSLRELLLSQSGWLKVSDGVVEIVKS